MLRSLTIRNFRNVKAEELSLKKINLIVGPNGAGKSNLINAFIFEKSLLTNEGRPTGLLQAIDEMGREDLLNRQVEKPGQFSMDWSAEPAPGQGLRHELAVSVPANGKFPAGYQLDSEFLAVMQQADEPPWKGLYCHDVFPGRGIYAVRKDEELGQSSIPDNQKHLLDVSPTETALRQGREFLKDERFYKEFYPSFDRAIQLALSYFGQFEIYRSTHFNLDAVYEGAQADSSVHTLDRYGVQLANVVRFIEEAQALPAFTAKMREMIRDLDGIRVIDATETRKQVELTVGGQRFRPRDLSDGTLKALLLASVLWNPEVRKVVAFDEPELNLHPAWLKILGIWLQRGTGVEQIFLSTHSPDLLDTFTEGFRAGDVALIVADTKDGGLRRVAQETLDPLFQEGWQLGDLYRVGHPELGGWPW